MANSNLKIIGIIPEAEALEVLDLRAGAIAADLGLGLTLDVGQQVIQDFGNSGLTPRQKVGRAGFVAVGSLAAGGAGLAVEAGLVSFGVASGPAGWIGIGVAVAADRFIGSNILPGKKRRA